MSRAHITREKIFYYLLSSIEDISCAAQNYLQDKQIGELKNKTYLVDIGINSIDYVEIIANMQDLLDMELSVNTFVNVSTIQEAVELIYEKTFAQSVSLSTGTRYPVN